MQKFITQVKHNEDFHSSICSNNPDNFFDWKITSLFYCSYHLLQSLAAYRGVSIGDRHAAILWNINPRNHNRVMQVKNSFFTSFDRLFEYSRNARYNGFTDFDTFTELKKHDYTDALKIYDFIKSYVQEQGVSLAA